MAKSQVRGILELLWVGLLGGILAGGLGAQERGLAVVEKKETPVQVGKQVAVFIGIDRYSQWLPLHKAVSEAKDLKKVLTDAYQIDQTFELYDEDATAANIRRLFAQTLPTQLDLHDSLLIFYAGHGHLDESQSGFWIPVDGSTDELTQDRWISNAQMRNYVAQLKAQRVLVMADSCFSGDFLNTTRGVAPVVDEAYFHKALQMTARQVLSSGASESVPDESEFARQLIGFLERNTEPMIDTLSIYERLRKGMTETLPLYGTLPGNETGASFVLFRKAGTPNPAPEVAAAPATPPQATLKLTAPALYQAWATPAGQTSATPVVLSNGVALASGSWVVQAQLPDDLHPTWTRTLSVPVTGTVALTIPPLAHSPEWELDSLEVRQSRLLNRLAQEQESGRWLQATGWTFFTMGLAGSAWAGYSYWQGRTAYSDYQGAQGASAAEARSRVEKASGTLWIAGGIGIAGLVLGTPFLSSDPTVYTRQEMKRVEDLMTLWKGRSQEKTP